MDFKQFEETICVLNKYSIKSLLGIILDCRDGNLQGISMRNSLRKLKKERKY